MTVPIDRLPVLIERWKTKLRFYEQQIAAWQSEGPDMFGATRADHQARAAMLREVIRDAEEVKP